MAKRKKRINPKSLKDCTTRPVKRSDKWCNTPVGINGKVPSGDAPYGFIVTIPYCPEKNTLLDNIDGVIVRSKKHMGNLLLQVVKTEDAPKYGVKSFARHEPNAGKRKRDKKNKLYRILNIRNFRKSGGKW